MKLMSEKQFSQWAKQRGKGEKFYTLKNFFVWSVWMTVGFTLFDWFYEEKLVILKIPFTFLIMFLVSLIFYVLEWQYYEIAFKEVSNSKSTKENL